MPSRTVDPPRADAGRTPRAGPGVQPTAPRRASPRSPPPAPPDAPPPPEQHWAAYRRDRCPAALDRLANLYLPLVHRIAQRLRARLPRHVELDELISSGSMGLLNAIGAFDPGRGIKFETFSQNRIRGAMIDGLRQMDWPGRRPREQAARCEHARQQIQMKTGRPATSEQIARSLGLDAEQVARVDRRPPTISSLSSSADGSTRDLEIPARGTDPRRDLHRKLVLELVTKHLTRAERLVVILYYYEGLTMKEIGLALGHSESRVSQIHKSILQRLRIRLRDHEPELEPIQ